MRSRRPSAAEVGALALGAAYLGAMVLAVRATHAVARALCATSLGEAFDDPDFSLTGLAAGFLLTACYLPLFVGGGLLFIVALLVCAHGWVAADDRGRRGWLAILGTLGTVAGWVVCLDGLFGVP